MDLTSTKDETELLDIIRRAKSDPDKTGSQRRRTLEQLIELTHSPYSTIKLVAASNIRLFFSDFPDLEEAAINAVYDLCEDQSPKVRIEGYNAITQVSKVSHKWIKRNADVLLQLLQSDEPEEVIVVKNALIEHLEMDPGVTLGVLCDQIVPLDEDMDLEEREMRDRLRGVVLGFMAGEANGPIKERHGLPESVGERVMISGLLNAVPKLRFAEVNTIVKDLLLPLPAFHSRTKWGSELITVLISKASLELAQDFKEKLPTLLPRTKEFLNLLSYLVSEKRLASPTPLLQFYCTSLIGKFTLQKLVLDVQIFIIRHLANNFRAVTEEMQTSDFLLKRQVVDACPYLFEILAKSDISHHENAAACSHLLRGCIQRRDETGWTVPPNLVAILKKPVWTSTFRSSEGSGDLIRSLVSHADPPPKTSSSSSRNQAIESSLPKLFPGVDVRTNPRIGSPRDGRQAMSQAANIQSEGLRSSSLKKHPLPSEDSPHLPKKPKNDTEDPSFRPSLLDRLAASGQKSPRLDADVATTRHETNKTPSGGYSIKGAARGIQPNAGVEADKRHRQVVPPQSSLLNRLETQTPTSDEEGNGDMGRRRQRKTWPHG